MRRALIVRELSLLCQVRLTSGDVDNKHAPERSAVGGGLKTTQHVCIRHAVVVGADDRGVGAHKFGDHDQTGIILVLLEHSNNEILQTSLARQVDNLHQRTTGIVSAHTLAHA